MASEPVSSDPSTALEQVERESTEKVKTIEKKPLANDESPGLDVTSSGPEQTAAEDENQVVPDRESWNDHVAEVDKAHVSGLTDDDGIINEAVKKELERPKEETSESELAESEAEVNKAKWELAKEIPEDNIEPSEPLNTVPKEKVQVKDSSEKIEVPESVHEVSNVEFEQSEPRIPKEPGVTEVIDVGKNEDFSEQKARVIEDLQKESTEAEAADKIEVDAAKDKESWTDAIESELELEPIGIDNPKQDGIITEEAYVEQKDRDFPPEADEKLDAESSGTEKLAVDKENEVKKEDTVVNEEFAMGIGDVSETEQTSREIALPVDFEGDKDETLSTEDKDIEVEKKVDAEEPYKSETGSRGEDLSGDIADELKKSVGAEAEQKVTQVPTSEAAENIDAKDLIYVETEDKEENVKVNDESAVPEAKGIKEKTNQIELPESNTEVDETKGEVDKENIEEIELSETLDDAAKKSSEKIEIPESVPEVSNVELEQSEAVIPKEAEVIEAKDLGNSAAKQVKNKGLSDEKDEITNELKKESAGSDAANKIEVDAAKDKESRADKVEGFELKSEVVLEPIIANDESNVEQKDTDFPPEAAENIDTKKLAMDMVNEDKKEDTVLEAKGNSDVPEAEQEASRDIELPTNLEGRRDEPLATTVKNNKDMEVEKKIDAEEMLESETGRKSEDFSVEKAKITEESKEIVETESTEKIDTDAAKDEAFLTEQVEEPVATQSSEETHAEHKDTEAPTSEAEQNIDTEDPIKTAEESNSIETSATDVENEEKKEDAVVNEESAVPEAKKIKEESVAVLPTTHDSDDVSIVEHTSREIQLPPDLATTEKYVEIEKNVDVGEAQESNTGTIEEAEKISEFVEPQRDQQKEVEGNVKLDAPTEEPVDVNAIEEAPKEEEVAPVKQKQSNNLLSKMKQSLVKAKKAIIKKAPSKTPPTS